MLQSVETLSRGVMADKLLESAYDMVTDPVLADVLPSVRDYQTAIENSFVVNVRHGKALVPRTYRNNDEALPILVHHRGEKIIIDGSMFTPSAQQQAQIDSKIASLCVGQRLQKQKMARSINTSLARYHEIIDAGRTNIVAVAAGNTAEVQFQPSRHITPVLLSAFGRQLVVLYSTALSYKGDVTPDQGLYKMHEITHILQGRQQPIVDRRRLPLYKNLWQREFEAYHYHARAAQMLYAESSNTKYRNNPAMLHDFAIKVERLRAHENACRRNPFEATHYLINLMLQKNLDAGPELEEV